MASWFDNQDFVEAYAPFGVMRDLQGVAQSNSLMSEGSPNSLFSDIVSDDWSIDTSTPLLCNRAVAPDAVYSIVHSKIPTVISAATNHKELMYTMY